MTHTAAQDSIIRLALSMAMADPKSSLSNPQRAWIRERLQVVDRYAQHLPLTTEELAWCRVALLTYVDEHRPMIAGIVRRNLEPAC